MLLIAQDAAADACLRDAARLRVPRTSNLDQVCADMLRQQLPSRPPIDLASDHLPSVNQGSCTLRHPATALRWNGKHLHLRDLQACRP